MHQDFLGEQQTESATSPVAWRAADRVCDQPGCMASSRRSLRPAQRAPTMLQKSQSWGDFCYYKIYTLIVPIKPFNFLLFFYIYKILTKTDLGNN